MAGDAVEEPAAVKRFYGEVRVEPAEGGFEIKLDNKPVRTPGRVPLVLPTRPLADSVATEWDVQGDKIDPRAMPLTGFANAAIDRIGPARQSFVEALAVYGETDLLCYRAESPQRLVRRQSEVWDPLLAWARGRYDIDFEVVCGLMHREQPAATVERLAKAVASRDDFALAALSSLVTIAGSLIVALALAEGAIDLSTAWSAAMLDETWQAENWGEDAEAAKVRAARRKDFEAAYRFLRLL